MGKKKLIETLDVGHLNALWTNDSRANLVYKDTIGSVLTSVPFELSIKDTLAVRGSNLNGVKLTSLRNTYSAGNNKLTFIHDFGDVTIEGTTPVLVREPGTYVLTYSSQAENNITIAVNCGF